MKKLIIFFTIMSMCFYANAQTWEWAHAEPNGPAFYTGEDDAAHHIKTDASGNVYVLGSFLGYLYLDNNIVTQGNGSYLAKYDPTGALLWNKIIVPDYGNTAGDTYIKASDLVVNSSGVYITGRYNYSFGARNYFNSCDIVVTTSKAYKIGSYSFTSSIYDIGLFVAKLTTDGDVIWNKTATDSYTDEHNCIQPATCGNCSSAADFPVLTSDPNNNLTVAFTYSPGFNLGTSGLIYDGTPIPSTRTGNNGGRDLIFINMNSDGNYRWSNTAFTNPYFLNNNIAGGDLECNSIAADNNGNVFITGQAGDHAAFGTDVVNTTPAGGSLRYIAKLSSSGAWVFEKTLTTYSSVSSLGYAFGIDASPNLLTIDANNDVYMLVNLARLPIYEQQYILGTLVPDPANASTYLLKMSNDGNAVWVKQFGWNYYLGSNYGFGICFANNDLYITGTLNSGRAGMSYYQFGNLSVPSASNSNSGEYFVSRCDINGNFKWANTFSAFGAAGFSVAVRGNEIYTGGVYKQKIYSLGNFNVDRSATTNNTTSEPFFGKLKDQYSHIGDISPTTLCAGASFTIPFTSFGLTLSGNNSFTAQLSDANGNFANAVYIGSASSTGSGSITATLPANLPMGSSGYKVRIVSSDLLNTGFPYYAYADINYNITVGDQTFYQDADGDGYGNPAVTVQTCSPPSGYLLDNTDCNDGDASIHIPITYYKDADGDGFGDANVSTSLCQSVPPIDYVTNNTDCDDTQKLYQDTDGDGYGSTTLVSCNGITNDADCDDNNSAIHAAITYYRDADGDGYGIATVTTSVCSITPPVGYVTNNTECNDNDIAIYPGATELCDGKDNNCNGTVDEGCNTIPAISVNDVTVYEMQGMATLTVSLSQTSTQAIKINYNTVDGTAISKGRGRNPVVDYTAAKGTITIPSGSLTGTINITITNDGIPEASEYFDIQMSIMKNVNATISKASGRVTILDGAAPTTKANSIDAEEINQTAEGLLIKSMPNPSANYFNISINSSKPNEKILLRTFDINGRIIEKRDNVVPGQIVKLGENYRPGIYLIEAVQANQRKTLKLIKQSD